MRRQLGGALVVLLLLASAPAQGAHWPVTGGDGSRSGAQRFDATLPPVAPLWHAPDVNVRTSVVVTGGGGPSVQRVAYGTMDGRVHLQILATGAPLGAEEGVDINEGSLPVNDRFFGVERGAVGMADTSTEHELGQLFVAHNDDAALVPGVHIAQFDLASGERVISPDNPIPGSAGCSTNSGLLLTPPAGDGTRLLYLTMTCASYRYLVRLPLSGDPTSPNVVFGDPGFTAVPGLTDHASPALVVLPNSTGLPSYYVAVPRGGGVDLFAAEKPLLPAPDGSALPPDLSVGLDPGETAVGVAAAATGADEVAGGEGTGTGPAPALYVTAQVGEPAQTRVYRFVPDAPAHLARQAATDRLPNSGAPAPGLVVAETVGPTGAEPGGVLVVPTAQNVTLLRAADLGTVAQLSATQPLPAGQGFARTVPVASGGLVYLQRDGDENDVAEHLVLSVADLSLVAAPGVHQRAGAAFGQLAMSRGHVIVGSPGGAFAYRTADGAPPRVAVVSPAAGSAVSGTAEVAAAAADARGVRRVDFRLTSGSTVRVVARVDQPASGDVFAGRYVATFPTAVAGAGEHVLEAVAVDAAGNEAVSERRRIRIVGGGSLPSGACVREMLGTIRPDRLLGSASGDRILGGPGDDRLDGAGGHDCVLGEAGDDVLAGGSGDDLLDGAGGDDTIAGGGGRNRYTAGAGRDVVRGGGVDRIAAGGGSDTVLGGAGSDRLAGGAGNDLLRGERGSDRISAGGGRNRIVAGAGHDRISSVNGRQDRIDCGPGRDRLVADRYDLVARCERVTRRLPRR